MRRSSLLTRVVIAISLAAPLAFTTLVSDATAADPLRTETFGMRASGGFPDPARVDRFERELGRSINWYVAFADRRNAGHMRSSVRGQMKPGSVLGERGGEINVVMTMPLAFGKGDGRTSAGQASIRTRLQETASGRWDADFRLAAQSLINGGHDNAVLRLGHEFTGGWYPWSARGNASAYVAAFRHIHDVMAAESPRFRFEWNGARNSFAEYGPAAYPGDKYVDIISLDVYYEPWKGDPAQLTGDIWSRRYEAPMSNHLEFAKEHGKQIAYSEWANGLVDQPKFIERMHEWFVDLPAQGGGSLAYQSYFNASNDKYNLDEYPESKAAYLRLFGRSDGSPSPPTNQPPSPPSSGGSAPTLDVTAQIGAVVGTPRRIPATADAETVRWWKVSGPGATWDDKNVVSPTVTFSEPGTYELRARAKNEGVAAVAKSVIVTVRRAEGSPTPPPVTAPDTTGQTVSVRDASAVEGSTLVFKFVASSAATSPISVGYTISDISTNGDDYRAVMTGEVTIATGDKIGYLGAKLLADGVREPDEELRVRITSIDGATVDDGVGKGTVSDR